MKKILLITVLLVCIFGISCTRDVTPVEASFEISGEQRINNELTFKSTSQNAFAYEWEFGDGGGSVEVNPTHTYESQGLYQVRLIVAGEYGSDTITKEINITTGGSYFAGSYRWRSVYHTVSPFSGGSSYPRPDSTFSIKALNDTTLEIMSFVLSYKPDKSTSKYLFFEMVPQQSQHASFRYYFNNDSMVFSPANIYGPFDLTYHIYSTYNK